LRTKQQTGYIVHSGSTQVQVNRSFLFLASQSSQVPPAKLLSLYEAFLERYHRRGTTANGYSSSSDAVFKSDVSFAHPSLRNELSEAAAQPAHPHPLRERFASIQRAKVTQLSQPYRNLPEMVAIVESLAYDRHGAFDRRQRRLEFTQRLTFDEFAVWALARLDPVAHPRRVRVEFYGDATKAKL